jgi:predicted transcriptional regulator
MAHRPGNIMETGRIALLERGVLINCDSPAALLVISSAFRRLHGIFESKGHETFEMEGSEIEIAEEGFHILHVTVTNRRICIHLPNLYIGSNITQNIVTLPRNCRSKVSKR